MLVVRPLARRYARAIFQMAFEKNQTSTVGGDLDRVAETCVVNPSLGRLLKNPRISVADKKKIVSAVLDKSGAGDLCRRFVEALLERGRMPHLPEVAAGYRALLEELERRAEAEVASARPLSSEEQKSLSAVLSRRTGRQINLKITVDPDLLGGLVVRIGTVVYDGSLRNQIERLGRQLAER